MITFKDSSTSTAMSVFYLILTALAFIVSAILNPTVFFYNKKKSSLAGILFSILSATDSVICVIYPSMIIYYAATINLDNLSCRSGANSNSRQPQNCFNIATPINMAITATLTPFKCTSFVTTGVLAIVRAVQIRYPFYPIKNNRVSFGFVAFCVLQVAMWLFGCFSPYSQKLFHPAFYGTMAVNPYGFNFTGHSQSDLDSTFNLERRISTYLACLPLAIVQISAVIATAVTALTLIQRRKNPISSNLRKSQSVAGAVKVLLTNVPSFLYALIFGTPIIIMIYQGSDGELVSEEDGWTAFSVAIMLPLLSSVWNPLVFIALTPKSRTSLKSLQKSAVNWCTTPCRVRG